MVSSVLSGEGTGGVGPRPHEREKGHERRASLPPLRTRAHLRRRRARARHRQGDAYTDAHTHAYRKGNGRTDPGWVTIAAVPCRVDEMIRGGRREREQEENVIFGGEAGVWNGEGGERRGMRNTAYPPPPNSLSFTFSFDRHHRRSHTRVCGVCVCLFSSLIHHRLHTAPASSFSSSLWRMTCRFADRRPSSEHREYTRKGERRKRARVNVGGEGVGGGE